MGFELRGLREAIEEHQLLAQRARDPSPLLEELRAELVEMIDRAWAQRRSPGGEAWPPTKRESESDGTLRAACDVRIEGSSIVISVGAEHASFAFFGTRHQPARNPLPVEPRGGALEWMTRGEAGAWLEALPARIEAYLTGADRGVA